MEFIQCLKVSKMILLWGGRVYLSGLTMYKVGDGPKMVEEWDGETTFSPTNSSKDHLNAEQLPQNNFRMLLEDTRHP